MDKFITSKKQNLAENLSEGFINEQEIHQKELEDNENIQQNDNNEGGHDNVQTCNVTILDNEAQNNLEESENINDQPNYIPTNIFDPSQWKTIDIKLRDLVVENGPIRVDDLNFPIDKNSKHFSTTHYIRKLPNGEKHDRKWLVYSKDLDKVFCFCCKLFNSKNTNQLANGGTKDWKNISSILKNHETTNEHITNMNTWIDLELRLLKNKTIDRNVQEQIKKEKDHWKKVLLRIIAVVKNLGKNNLAFRGKNKKIYQENNGNFLSIIEMIAEFDPVMQEHVQHIQHGAIHNHCLGHNIQNEVIQLLANEIKSKIIKKIKEAKYFSIILDCTPDVSHQEQMTLILRCVDNSISPIKIDEHFVDFLKVDNTFGKGLFNEIINAMKNLELDINGVRGQGYDNWSKMKGKKQGPLSQTRWESRIESVKVIKFQVLEIRDALLQLAKTSEDPKTKSEADCLATYEIESFEFLLAMTIWYDILFVVNSVSLKSFLKKYREDGFTFAMNSSKEIATKMEIKPIFCENRIIRRKKQFDENIKLFLQLKVDDDSLKKNCLNLECFLIHETYSDIDGLDLFSELKVLKEVLQINENSAINVLNYIKRLESFPNAFASAERSFSKVKLIKSYLRSIMSQERLSGLTILSIEKEINFASQKARKINFN
ncbi:hypothetical protein ACB092_06G120700 [Castanea dentata]